MFTIAHLSDLRFGAIGDLLVSATAADIEKLGPDLVVISGNLTQRAAPAEFEAARRFVDALPGRKLVVPGPRDGFSMNPFDRWLRPWRAWRAAMSDDLAPFISDPHASVLGIAGAGQRLRPVLSAKHSETIRSRLNGAPGIGVLVVHHPLVPRATGSTVVLNTVPASLDAVAHHVDLVLSGHEAVGSTQDTRIAYRILDRRAVVAQAAMVHVTGDRDATPYYNAVRLDGDVLSIAVRLWRGTGFEEQGAKAYRKQGTRWEKFVNMPSDFTWSDSETKD